VISGDISAQGNVISGDIRTKGYLQKVTHRAVTAMDVIAKDSDCCEGLSVQGSDRIGDISAAYFAFGTLPYTTVQRTVLTMSTLEEN
jgi:hypothetical protein